MFLLFFDFKGKAFTKPPIWWVNQNWTKDTFRLFLISLTLSQVKSLCMLPAICCFLDEWGKAKGTGLRPICSLIREKKAMQSTRTLHVDTTLLIHPREKHPPSTWICTCGGLSLSKESILSLEDQTFPRATKRCIHQENHNIWFCNCHTSTKNIENLPISSITWFK